MGIKSLVIEYTCDRCGKSTKNRKEQTQWSAQLVASGVAGTCCGQLLLCPTCGQSFAAWMSRKPKPREASYQHEEPTI